MRETRKERRWGMEMRERERERNEKERESGGRVMGGVGMWGSLVFFF